MALLIEFSYRHGFSRKQTSKFWLKPLFLIISVPLAEANGNEKKS
jgi:hypothetical protein